ncbi:MAG: hypothetical protein RSE94_01605 [Pseudomonas sp.]
MSFSVPLNTYMTENTMITFAPSVTAEERQDALSLLLQARLFASKAFDPRVHWKSWMDRYRNRLEKHGCQLQSLITEPARVVRSAKELKGIVAKVAGEVGAADLAEQVSNAVGQIKETGFAGRFFSKGENGGAYSEFVAVPCGKNQAGDVVLLVFAINIGLSVEVRDFDFWTETQRDMVVHVVGGLYRFDRKAYAQHRATVEAYLIEAARARIRTVNITPKAH